MPACGRRIEELNRRMDDTRTDFLTGFYLRESLVASLEDHISAATLRQSAFSLALIDVDRFKKFNDTYGHIFGDAILKYFASVLRLTSYENKFDFFRYGGDEFVVVFPDTRGREGMHFVRQCAYNLTHRPFLYKNRFYKIRMSCGIAEFPGDAGDPEGLIRKADRAMYFSKRHGRNRSTLSRQIPYLKMRNLFYRAAGIGIGAWSLMLLYHNLFDSFIKPMEVKIKTLKIVTKPQDLDMIILKNGTVFEGRILNETKDQVVMRLYLEKGEGSAVFKKSDIAKIRH